MKIFVLRNNPPRQALRGRGISLLVICFTLWGLAGARDASTAERVATEPEVTVAWKLTAAPMPWLSRRSEFDLSRGSRESTRMTEVLSAIIRVIRGKGFDGTRPARGVVHRN